jgi:hypothetical protein
MRRTPGVKILCVISEPAEGKITANKELLNANPARKKCYLRQWTQRENPRRKTIEKFPSVIQTTFRSKIQKRSEGKEMFFRQKKAGKIVFRRTAR